MIGIEPYASRESFSKVSVRFDSGGTECAAWLYRPDRPRSAPLVVMGPGLAAERTFGYPGLAEGLAERGVATLLFDYRYFGDSDGTPRGLVSIRDQLADWAAAVERAVHLDGVDTDRLALWGHSLGGGHALRIAARDHRVDAVVGHSPIVDGRAVLRANGYAWLGAALAAGVRDRLLGLAGRPNRIPVVPPGAYRGEESAGSAGTPDIGDASI
ncbi:MAG: alpha/beta hydrolase, partial [Haloferacaceae archaeon]